MIGLLILILLSALIAGSIKDRLSEAFSGDWLRFEETPTERERLEAENEEYSWGHNIKNYMEENL
jgi:hypothetical protein